MERDFLQHQMDKLVMAEIQSSSFAHFYEKNRRNFLE